MKLYPFSSESLTTISNDIKENLLEKLERDGLLRQPAEEIARHYVVILHEPHWLGRAFAAMCGIKEKDLLKITIAKVDK